MNMILVGNTASASDGPVVPWWSFTKTVLAAAVLALVRDGILHLDDSLPDAPYTLRHLLQHRSGLPDYGGLPEYHAAVERGEEPWPLAELLARCDAGRLRYTPGEGWGYSNIGYWHLGQTVAHAFGEPLGRALDLLVFGPLGIEGVHLAQTRADLKGLPGLVAGYHPGWVYHGLLVGPLAAAARLLHGLLASGFLPPGLLRAMRHPYRLGGPVSDRPWLAPGYGLGLMCGEAATGLHVEGHSGGGPGSVVAVYHRPAEGVTAAGFSPGADMAALEAAVFRYT
ncbi:MAG: serine hydrolase domain-containing protein [Ferrovibrio sp.]|uniref:serine hydrolase domain-containing protein n=1 Tax=Ferrovibrio sp. TaxID=1917215 RepID=UPI00391BFD91